MMFPVEFATQFAVGTVAGIGQSFGQQLIPWVVKSWRWLAGKGEPSHGQIVRKVTCAELARTGIPAGYRLFRKQADTFLEIGATDLTGGVPPHETLWLFPAGQIWHPTRFAAGVGLGQAEICVEFSPENKFQPTLNAGGPYDQNWLSVFLQGTLAGILNSLGRQSQVGFLQGDAAAVSLCSERLDQSLQGNGVRCRGIRGITASSISSSGDASNTFDGGIQDLAAELAEVKTPQDWARVVDGLKAAGVPVDAPTTEKLAALQTEVLDRHIPPADAVRQLGELTADAFQRAGIEEPDLQRWQLISQTLGDIPGIESSEESTPASVSVAKSKRPSTWFVWSRDEVDRRQLLYTRRTVKNCRTACEQGILHLRDISALREVRGLKEQVTLIEDMLASIPPLTPSRSSMRVEREVAKTLVAAYADAVKTTGQLADQIDVLLKTAPNSDVWTERLQGCRESVSRLGQMVRDRRAVR